MNNQTTAQKVGSWVSVADMSKPFVGPVFGGHDAKIKAMTAGFKAQFSFQKRQYGFFREHVGATTSENPIIVVSQRKVKYGHMNKMLTAFNNVADYFYENIPGVIAIINAIDANDKNMVNDLQIFKDMAAF